MEVTSLAPYTLLLARHSASEITRTSTPSSRGLGSSAASEVVPKPVTRAAEPGAGEWEAGGRHTGVMPLPGHTGDREGTSSIIALLALIAQKLSLSIVVYIEKPS